MSALRNPRSLLLGFLLAFASLLALAPSSIASDNNNAPGYPVAIHNGNSKLCLGVQNGSTAQGASVIQWQCNGNSDQQWRYVAVAYQRYKIVNVNSGLCLGAYGGDNWGDRSIQWGCNGNPDQIWGYHGLNSGYAQLINGNGFCLDMPQSSTSWGTGAIQWQCSGDLNQLWY